MKSLTEVDFRNKVVFLRADLDVPLERAEDSQVDLEVEQGTRLVNLRETVSYLLQKGCKVLIAGHIDRPSKPDPALSTKLLLDPLRRILTREIVFREDFGTKLESPLILFENLRFWPGEVVNDSEFAKKLAVMADVYVNEAFGNSHRSHASMVALPQMLPHAAGLHLEQEVKVLSGILKNPKRPFVAIVGGAKIETKIPLIENLAKIADYVLVGGEIAKEIQNTKYKLQNFSAKVKVASLTNNDMDISSESIDLFKSTISQAKTIIWNGPLGLFEEGWDKGTKEIAKAIIESSAYSVVGGGETSQFLTGRNLISQFSFVSAGGGAMLEFLAGKALPAIEALE